MLLNVLADSASLSGCGNMFQQCFTIITEHICGFMNNFIEIGIFPDILKRSCITPTFKKGDSSSGVTKGPADPAVQGGAILGGAPNRCLKVGQF